jgi:hypothetical protein
MCKIVKYYCKICDDAYKNDVVMCYMSRNMTPCIIERRIMDNDGNTSAVAVMLSKRMKSTCPNCVAISKLKVHSDICQENYTKTSKTISNGMQRNENLSTSDSSNANTNTNQNKHRNRDGNGHKSKNESRTRSSRRSTFAKKFMMWQTT